MRINNNAANRDAPNRFVQTLLDWAATLFKISLFTTGGMYAYLLFGLFSGQLADATQSKADPTQLAHTMQLINTLSLWLEVSLLVTLVTTVALFYEQETLGVIFVLIAAFLAYGLQFSIDMLFTADSARLTSGKASVETLQTLHETALMIAVPGILLVLYHLGRKVFEGHNRHDLTSLTYGKGVKRENRPKALIPAAARCWELPFCREGIRVKCPIFHAKTKCWKERVGCMCEENIILLAMEGGQTHPQDMTREQGFVPIGDLLTKPTTATTGAKVSVPTRSGPRGVRIPTNPHLTAGQKAERCRNCVIYNEHQRQKYKLLSPMVTLIVPLLVYLQFDTIRGLLESGMRSLDGIVGGLSFTKVDPKSVSALTSQVTTSFSVETILIVCFTLVAMTWALRFLEYCTFKIKI